jgi:hypothetical protein
MSHPSLGSERPFTSPLTTILTTALVNFSEC